MGFPFCAWALHSPSSHAPSPPHQLQTPLFSQPLSAFSASAQDLSKAGTFPQHMCTQCRARPCRLLVSPAVRSLGTSSGDGQDWLWVSISMGGHSGFPLPVLTPLEDGSVPSPLSPGAPGNPPQSLFHLPLSPPSTNKLEFIPFTIHTNVCTYTRDLHPAALLPVTTGPQYLLKCLFWGGH